LRIQQQELLSTSVYGVGPGELPVEIHAVGRTNRHAVCIR